MNQLFFILVFGNFIWGSILAAQFLREKVPATEDFVNLLENSIFQIVLSVITMIAGLITLFALFPGRAFFVEDLLPALSLILAGGVASIDKWCSLFKKECPFLEKVIGFRERFGFILGLAAIALSIVHFFGPNAVFF